MVIKILELGILRKLTEKEEESYQGGTSTEGADPPVSSVSKVKNATVKSATNHVNIVPKPLIVPKLPVVSKPLVELQKIETT
ncbi:MAG: hypothetical protein RMZ43_021375 [Nostoc sp. CmiVER01]|uniref:hypothetical protein n=1 Tax=Nostoc sp. CmiVER01 TaxID=3075384 RepID=UPI002AD5302E|nr:hypothetical protein [Nostoc sp. CmiVER01]MDZ8126327.1 hypothetical protein [Nostoc sp. CmiVER01]